MQSLSWYLHRLRSMSPGEIVWRVQGKAGDTVGRFLAARRKAPLPADRVRVSGLPPFDERAVNPGWTAPGDISGLPGDAVLWRETLRLRADVLRQNRLTLFDLVDHPLGKTINWNYEYKAGKPAPLIYAPDIDYRDYNETGDCKFVWEPSRHYHWVTLARAYRLTGRTQYAETIAAQLESWIEQCPYGYGMNWRSPLELAIRLINWAWAFELIRPSGVMTPERMDRVLGVVWRHLWDISRKYSRYSSANNHRIGEAAGVYIGAAYFSGLRGAQRWRQTAHRILFEEIFAQTYPDGGNREQALSYHLFVLEFFLLAGITARRIGEDFPAGYWEMLEKKFDFVAALSAGGPLPMYGDADDGTVLDLGWGADRTQGLLAIGAILLDRPDWKLPGVEFPEAAYWALGPDAFGKFTAMKPAARPKLLSQAFPETGLYLLQAGHAGESDRISLTMDCGELGLGSIAAHGHADALSITLRVGGHDILVDPGTYDYFTYRPYRDYFRSTRAHNTIVVDDQDQSEPLGLFLWGSRARARCTCWEPTPEGGTVAGEHDGYRRLPMPVMHRRTVRLNASSGEVVVRDELTGDGEHTAVLYLHFGEACTVAAAADNRFTVDSPAGRIVLELDAGWETRLVRGQEDPPLGWVSRGYHKKTPAFTLMARCTWQTRLERSFRLTIPLSRRDSEGTFAETADGSALAKGSRGA